MARTGGVEAAKQAVRERVWAVLERERLARFPGARGRIPNFAGAEQAAAGLARLPEWEAARVVKANPDSPQLPVRSRVLAAGKLLYMAVPKLQEQRPFVVLDPARLDVPPRKAAAKDSALTLGDPTAVPDMSPVDLVVCGTVAVNRDGVRVGKGGGFSDIELGLLVEAGLVTGRTSIVTTVHDRQVLDEELPETGHDFRVDLVVTPHEVIRTGATKRSRGILWDHLPDDKIASIPALAARRP
ncbi:5-formyltetrahydrofolate cyclo-ligase [Prauserella muralis]|uniref:5-formyltetrahydrofolate cyclo-ligase n=1 Tax=Prauserella muralis TaxID=588067 RepID=A0A2V4B9J6_9PSEU|nr:5-formyltetrahydrofolate cyclo-ligase [Prauserella muralis]PXY31957.1 5-formyltetrahydrofolate cyclo-ligase [Prauserella muralis]TWE13617.1 5-formyltetrahydrofolate cyclo-ligase [Prauserella muralis]